MGKGGGDWYIRTEGSPGSTQEKALSSAGQKKASHGLCALASPAPSEGAFRVPRAPPASAEEGK